MHERPIDIDRYRELLLRAGLTPEEARRIIDRVEQDMAELFGTEATGEANA